MHADDRADPSCRSAGAGDAADGFVEDRRIALQAAPLLGLQKLEEPDLVEFGDSLVGQAAQILGCLRPLGDQRQQIVDAG